MSQKHDTFETERLILRPISEADAPFILELFNCPSWLKYIGDRNVKSSEDAKTFIKNKIRPQHERLGYSNYVLIRKSDGAKMGTCGLYDREGLEGIDIGFALLPRYEKKGYAFEAADKIKNIGIEIFGITQMTAVTTKDNTSSQKLLEKLGLKFKKTIFLPNDDEELLMYELPE